MRSILAHVYRLTIYLEGEISTFFSLRPSLAAHHRFQSDSMESGCLRLLSAIFQEVLVKVLQETIRSLIVSAIRQRRWGVIIGNRTKCSPVNFLARKKMNYGDSEQCLVGKVAF